MKTKTVVVAALAAVLALTTVRAADLTPADSSAVVLTKEEAKAIAEGVLLDRALSLGDPGSFSVVPVCASGRRTH